MSRLIDLTSKRFGRLTVISRAENEKRQGQARWNCVCECGTHTVCRGSHLRDGSVLSCGCLRLEKGTKAKVVHGGRYERLYRVWRGMIERCSRVNHIAYEGYGGRGIEVCSEWQNDFDAFRAWAKDNGYDENAPRFQCTIDRIDNDGNYSPENCRFVTAKEQAANRRRPQRK